MARRRLEVVQGAGGLGGAEAVGRRDDGPARCAPDPGAFQQECIDAFAASQVAQGFSQITIDNGTGVLERFLALAGKPAWEITEHNVDRVIAALVKRGVSQTTRRGYVQAFRGFFGFLEARKAAEIETLFGGRLQDPLDRFNSARHVSSETPGLVPPLTVERVEAFFAFLRERLETARKWAPAARDYALFRTLYHAGLRAQEAAALEIRDVHFNRGPFGKLHVRLGKGARGSGQAVWQPSSSGRTSGLRRSAQPCGAPAASWWRVAESRSKRSRPHSRPTSQPRWKESEMLGRDRLGRPGLLGGRPVARTAAVAGTAAVVTRGVRRRGDRREDRRDDRRDRREERRFFR